MKRIGLAILIVGLLAPNLMAGDERGQAAGRSAASELRPADEKLLVRIKSQLGALR